MVCDKKNKIWTFMDKGMIRKKVNPKFEGESFRFLSNFWIFSNKRTLITIRNIKYMSVEHYYQAMKFTNTQLRRSIRESRSPAVAKRIARQNIGKIRKDWKEVNLKIMEQGIRAKFTQNERLKRRLLATGNRCLEEGNTWGDTFWGIDLKTGKGQNNLGKILMKVRAELRRNHVMKMVGARSLGVPLNVFVVPYLSADKRFIRFFYVRNAQNRGQALRKLERSRQFLRIMGEEERFDWQPVFNKVERVTIDELQEIIDLNFGDDDIFTTGRDRFEKEMLG